jgi:hypothetical protein
MIFSENLNVSFRSLRANPLRSLLTLIGMAVGIAAVLYVVVLGETTQRRIKTRMEALGSNVLVIRPGFSHHGAVRTASNVVNPAVGREGYSIIQVITRIAPTYGGGVTAEYQIRTIPLASPATPDYGTRTMTRSSRAATSRRRRTTDANVIAGATAYTKLLSAAGRRARPSVNKKRSR